MLEKGPEGVGGVGPSDFFAGFFGSLEEVNVSLRARQRWRLVWTPGHLR